jgi:hypothetical protein
MICRSGHKIVHSLFHKPMQQCSEQKTPLNPKPLMKSAVTLIQQVYGNLPTAAAEQTRHSKERNVGHPA